MAVPRVPGQPQAPRGGQGHISLCPRGHWAEQVGQGGEHARSFLETPICMKGETRSGTTAPFLIPPGHCAFCSLFSTHCPGPFQALAVLATPSVWPQGEF